MFQTKVVEEMKTNILCSITFFFRKSCHLWDNVENVCRTGQATDDNMAHAHCMMDTQGYWETLGICNIYCFSTTIIIARRRLNDTLYVRRLSCMRFEQTCRQYYDASALRDLRLCGEKWNYILHSTWWFTIFTSRFVTPATGM